MYSYFYNFHKRLLGSGLFNRTAEQGIIPPPPASKERVTEAGIVRITEDGKVRVTE